MLVNEPGSHVNGVGSHRVWQVPELGGTAKALQKEDSWMLDTVLSGSENLSKWNTHRKMASHKQPPFGSLYGKRLV